MYPLCRIVAIYALSQLAMHDVAMHNLPWVAYGTYYNSCSMYLLSLASSGTNVTSCQLIIHPRTPCMVCRSTPYLLWETLRMSFETDLLSALKRFDTCYAAMQPFKCPQSPCSMSQIQFLLFPCIRKWNMELKKYQEKFAIFTLKGLRR